MQKHQIFQYPALAAKEAAMAEKNPRKNPTTDALFAAILSLETREECY